MNILSPFEKKVDNLVLYTMTLLPIIHIVVNFAFFKYVDLFTGLSQFWITLLIVFSIYSKTKNVKQLIKAKYILFSIIFFLMFFKAIQVRGYDNLTKWNALSISVFCLIILFFSDAKERKKVYKFLIEKQILINIGLVLYFFVLLITMLNRRGFEFLWGSITLKGPYSLQHYLAYDLMTIISITELLRIYTKKHLYGIYTVISLALILISGVRVVLIPLFLIGVVEFILIKSRKVKIIISLSAVLSVFIVIVSGIYKMVPVLEKFMNTFKGGSISNGRNTFWVIDIKEFYKLNVSQKLFGAGANWVFDLNKKAVNQFIHAHNDYINVLVMFGLITLIIFIAFNVICINYTQKYLFMAVLFSLAFLNGLFTYSIFVISMPIMITLFDYSSNIEEMENIGND